MLSGCDWWILIRSVNNMQDWWKVWKRFHGCFVFQSRVSTKMVVKLAKLSYGNSTLFWTQRALSIQLRNFWNRQMAKKCPWKDDRKSENCCIFKMAAIEPKILEILRGNQVEGKFTFRIVLKIWVYLASLSFTCLIIMNKILQMPVWKNSSYNFLLNLYLHFC